jgi:hypothetical protein
MKNFHLPLPDQASTRLRAEAERAQVPTTALAREAIDWWLRQPLRKGRHQQIAAYAVEAPGTRLDLDPDLEAAGIEHLIKTGALTFDTLWEVESALNAAMDLD